MIQLSDMWYVRYDIGSTTIVVLTMYLVSFGRIFVRIMYVCMRVFCIIRAAAVKIGPDSARASLDEWTAGGSYTVVGGACLCQRVESVFSLFSERRTHLPVESSSCSRSCSLSLSFRFSLISCGFSCLFLLFVRFGVVTVVVDERAAGEGHNVLLTYDMDRRDRFNGASNN